ncbi:MAG: hypothetical protein JNM09_21285 [Blastocatellia bacterium]|nr:hypothetical protein [Blastocatellia bacterium]
MQNSRWHLIFTALVKFWRTEVMLKEATSVLPPIRYIGDTKDMYLA